METKKKKRKAKRVTISHYCVTGVLYNSKTRFSYQYTSLIMALSINLWNGSVWEVDSKGRRKLIKRVIN